MDEFSLIHRYFQRPENSPAPSGIRLGIGDDAALLTPPAHHELAISTDTLIAGRHFPIDTDPYSIGWKAVAVNLSDIAAMGARPHSILLALTLPEANPDFLKPLADGLFALCDTANVRLIGGDTTRGKTLSLTLTALGWIPTGQAILRSGAQAGDLIVVSGTLGDAAYALQHLNDPDLDPWLKSRLDRPTPRLALGIALREYASAMLDISDGLAQDLSHILAASSVSGQIHLDDLPLSPTLTALNPEQRAAFALSGGDDYELCFTISPSKFAILQSIWQNSTVPLSVIGQINASDHNKNGNAQNNLTILYQQKPFNLTQQGFRHFE